MICLSERRRRRWVLCAKRTFLLFFLLWALSRNDPSPQYTDGTYTDSTARGFLHDEGKNLFCFLDPSPIMVGLMCFFVQLLLCKIVGKNTNKGKDAINMNITGDHSKQDLRPYQELHHYEYLVRICVCFLLPRHNSSRPPRDYRIAM